MSRHTVIDLNYDWFNYHPFMISLDKRNRRCIVAPDLFTETCVLCETKDANVKVFNMVTRINAVKALVKHISCDCKCKFDSTQHVIEFKNRIMINVNVTANTIALAKMSLAFYMHYRLFKIIVDNSVIANDEVISVTYSVSTNVTNTISTNVRSIVYVNSGDKKLIYQMDCCIISDHITIFNHCYLLSLSKK